MNDSKAEGLFDEAKGKLKQAFGETTNNQSVANEGAADQVKGHAEQTWGNVKDTAHDVAHSNSTTTATSSAESQHTSHGLRDDITNAAEHMKEGINHGLDSLKHKSNS